MVKTQTVQVVIYHSDRYDSIQEAIVCENGHDHLPSERICQDTNIIFDKIVFDWTDKKQVGYRIWNIVKGCFNEDEREFNKIVALSTLEDPQDLVDYLNNN